MPCRETYPIRARLYVQRRGPRWASGKVSGAQIGEPGREPPRKLAGEPVRSGKVTVNHRAVKCYKTEEPPISERLVSHSILYRGFEIRLQND
jgi:hypothetical protein